MQSSDDETVKSRLQGRIRFMGRLWNEKKRSCWVWGLASVEMMRRGEDAKKKTRGDTKKERLEDEKMRSWWALDESMRWIENEKIKRR